MLLTLTLIDDCVSHKRINVASEREVKRAMDIANGVISEADVKERNQKKKEKRISEKSAPNKDDVNSDSNIIGKNNNVIDNSKASSGGSRDTTGRYGDRERDRRERDRERNEKERDRSNKEKYRSSYENRDRARERRDGDYFPKKDFTVNGRSEGENLPSSSNDVITEDRKRAGESKDSRLGRHKSSRGNRDEDHHNHRRSAIRPRESKMERNEKKGDKVENDAVIVAVETAMPIVESPQTIPHVEGVSEPLLEKPGLAATSSVDSSQPPTTSA